MSRWLRRPPDEFIHDGRPLGGDVDWAAFPWPDGHACDRKQILRALRAVVEPHRRDWTDAATMVRFAVGNDHGGTVYPAAVAMSEQLLTIARHYPGLPRWVAIAVLDDWWSGYEPEPGFESYTDADGVRVGVIPQIVRRITDATGLLTRIATDDADPVTAALARDLLTVLPLGWGNTIGINGVVENWGGRINPDGFATHP